MIIIRGPGSKPPFFDDSHQRVAKIAPEEIKESLTSNAPITFNITKDGRDQYSVCNAYFEDADILPMIQGLISRLTARQICLDRIREIMNDSTKESNEKINAIRREMGMT